MSEDGSALPEQSQEDIETGQDPTAQPKRRALFPRRRSKVEDGRYDHFLTESIEQYPRGYPRLASYVNTDIDGRLYRRFGYLRNRLLLHLQDQICEIEEQLAQLDEEDADGEDDQVYRLHSRRFDEEDLDDCRRKPLLTKLSKFLKEYDDLLLREHQIMSIRQPSRKVHRAYFDYIWNDKPVCKEEYQFIYRRDDFLVLGIQEDGWLGSWTETLARFLPNKILKYLLSSREERQKSDKDAGVQFYSNERTEKVVKSIVGAATTILLVLPIVVLYILSAHGSTAGVRIGVLLVFVVAFAVALALLTRATRHEMFGASAA